MLHALFILLKAVCYIALAVVAAAILSLVVISNTGACPRLDEGAIQCASPFIAQVGGIAMAVLLMMAFTGVPALLAFAGLVFLFRDLRRWWRNRSVPAA